jgi:hypothetical protein
VNRQKTVDHELAKANRRSGRAGRSCHLHWNEYRATQAWLRDLLIDAGLAGDDGERLELIHGSVQDEERERINREFNYDPIRTPVRILLCTDAASEGIDLHEQCHRVVHVDIPFPHQRWSGATVASTGTASPTRSPTATTSPPPRQSRRSGA